MPGHVKNPYAYMSKAAVFVLSSAWEGLGNVLIEAMAEAILNVLSGSSKSVDSAWLKQFSVKTITQKYLDTLNALS
jgi:hypothetical protein